MGALLPPPGHACGQDCAPTYHALLDRNCGTTRSRPSNPPFVHLLTCTLLCPQLPGPERFRKSTGLEAPKVNGLEFPVRLGFTKENELSLGRLAMLGFASNLIGEIITGKGALAQVCGTGPGGCVAESTVVLGDGC